MTPLVRIRTKMLIVDGSRVLRGGVLPLKAYDDTGDSSPSGDLDLFMMMHAQAY